MLVGQGLFWQSNEDNSTPSLGSLIILKLASFILCTFLLVNSLVLIFCSSQVFILSVSCKPVEHTPVLCKPNPRLYLVLKILFYHLKYIRSRNCYYTTEILCLTTNSFGQNKYVIS